MMDLLLLSNSTNHGSPYLAHALEAIIGFVPARGTLAFVPYALADHDGYTEVVRAALAPTGITVRGVHADGDPVAALRGADAVFAGGGNSFRLLRDLYATGLRDALRTAVRAGLPYMGASAGTNMACPTLRTTNDMPIVAPPGFAALDLVPFQINPHYVDPVAGDTHMGETREQRLTEFLECNDVPVLGLREGTWLRVAGGSAALGGPRAARLFRRGAEPRDIPAGADVSALLGTVPVFDS